MVSSNSATLRNQGTPNQSPSQQGRSGDHFYRLWCDPADKNTWIRPNFKEYLNVWSLSKEKENLSLVWEFSQVETAAWCKGGTEMRVQAEQVREQHHQPQGFLKFRSPLCMLWVLLLLLWTLWWSQITHHQIQSQVSVSKSFRPNCDKLYWVSYS